METVQFKSWWCDEEKGEWGAFYLFETEDALRDYVTSERWTKVIPAKYGCAPTWRAVEPGPVLSKKIVTDFSDNKAGDSTSKGITGIETALAPKAIGPYSQAVSANGFLFVSGQLGIDPGTGEMVKGDVKEQTARVLDNISAILAARGLGFEHVVKVEVFLKSMADFQVMNQVYEKRFKGPVRPARQAFAVAALPKEALVEISCIAFTTSILTDTGTAGRQ
ncbi:MAG: hypothetical protein C4582_02710 [Desulfobacteraceae bacterium]|nr:MAG: hypothetical protein C4582_02710 [Desulfobacteraceae bacterium]